MKRLLLLALLILLLVAPALPTSAQGGLQFEVPKVDLNVFVQKDASARLVYDIEFANVRGSPTNFVDIGLPHGDYDKESVQASINGAPVTSFSPTPSDILKHGVTADLGARSFEGDFHLEVTVRDLVFQDSTNDELASFQITPTWFGSQYVRGNTDLTTRVHLPAGVSPDAALFHDVPFTDKRIEGDSVVVEWRFPSTQFTGPHLVGVSFPKSVMDRIVTKSWLDKFEENTGLRILSGALFMALFGLVFFRFTGGTGFVVFIPFVVAFAIIVAVSPVVHLALWPVLLVAGIWAEWTVRKRRAHYLPPLATVEGGGVKHGFTAPEVATILELPLSTVCSLVLAELLKKGVLRPAAAGDAQLLEVIPELRGTRGDRRKEASDRGIVLHQYEQAFLDVISDAGDSFAIKDVDYSDALKEMIENVAARMKSFDLDETRSYYRGTVDRAWTDVESQTEPAERERAAEQQFEWLVLDEESDDRFEAWRSRGYFYRPGWLLFDLRAGRGDACSWLDSTCESVQDNINVGFDGDGGVINLRGIDTATGAALKAIGEGLATSGGSYSGGGGCACACAGCACACACAGGGR